MAVDPSLVDSLTSAGTQAANVQAAASVVGDLGQSTTAALKEFTVNLPEASQLLTTTLRSAGEGTGGILNPSAKLPLDLGLAPQMVASSLSPVFQSILSEPKYWGSLIIAVIISDILQNSAAVQKRNREFTAEYNELENRLLSTEKSYESVKALQGDAVALSKQLEDARAEIAAYKLKEEYNTMTSTKSLESNESTQASAAKESASSPGGTVARDMEITRLRKELAEEKKKRTAAAASLYETTSTIIEKPKSTNPAAPVPKDVVARERALVDSLKKFLIKEGYMAEGLANMLMSATAPKELEKLAKGNNQLKGASDEEKKKMKTMEKELTALVKEVGALQKENDRLNQASSSKPDADAYVKELIAEVEGLKKQLLSSDERLMDLQQDMQKKVDSAKLMTKELNARLQESEAKATKWMEAATAAKSATSKVAANKKGGAPAPTAAEVRAAETGRKAELKGMTQAAVKKLTKAQLEKDAIALGATPEQLEGLTKPKVLDIVFTLLA